MLGVPTRSDAVELSPEYAEMVAEEARDERLNRFDYLFSTVFPHNHVVGAYREAGLDFPMRGNVWDIKPKRRVRRKIEPFLDAQLIGDNYMSSVQNYREILEEARTRMDKETEIVTQSADHKPREGVSPIVIVEECETDHAFVGNAWVPGEGKGWKYVYNPHQLARRVLDGFEADITYVSERERTQLGKIAGMMATAQATQDSADAQLVNSAISLSRPSGSTFAMEHDADTEIGKLYDQNRAVMEESDIALRFDELYFHAQGGRRMIPAAGVLDTEERMHYTNLSNRVMLRSLISRVVEQKGAVNVNGTRYALGNIADDAGSQVGFVADRETDPELVNLFGRPVEQPDGLLLQPEAWASDEVSLVTRVRHGEEDAVRTMLERYDLDSSSGHPSRDKAINQLMYSIDTNH